MDVPQNLTYIASYYIYTNLLMIYADDAYRKWHFLKNYVSCNLC